MSLAYFICAEREVEGFAAGTPDGKALADASEHLEAVAQAAGVPSLFEFLSVDPETAAAMGGWEDPADRDPDGDAAPAEDEDDEEAPGPDAYPPEEWFAAADGLITIRALIRDVEADPDALAAALDSGTDPAAVLEDLREFESILGHLDAAGVGWHLGIDL